MSLFTLRQDQAKAATEAAEADRKKAKKVQQPALPLFDPEAETQAEFLARTGIAPPAG